MVKLAVVSEEWNYIDSIVLIYLEKSLLILVTYLYIFCSEVVLGLFKVMVLIALPRY